MGRRTERRGGVKAERGVEPRIVLIVSAILKPLVRKISRVPIGSQGEGFVPGQMGRGGHLRRAPVAVGQGWAARTALSRAGMSEGRSWSSPSR